MIGAVQPYLDFIVADSVAMEQMCNRSCMILRCSPVWRATRLESMNRLRLFLNLFLNAGALPIYQLLVSCYSPSVRLNGVCGC